VGNPEADRNKSLSVTVYLTKSEFVKQKKRKQAGESGSPEVGVIERVVGWPAWRVEV